MFKIFEVTFEYEHFLVITIAIIFTIVAYNLVDLLKLVISRKIQPKTTEKALEPVMAEDKAQNTDTLLTEPKTAISKDSLSANQRLALAELEAIEGKIRLLEDAKKHYIKKLNETNNGIKPTK